MIWKPEPWGSFHGIHERDHAAQAIRLHRDGHRAQGQRGARDEAHVHDARAPEIGEGEGEDHEHHGIAHVGLEERERRHASRHQQQGEQSPAEARHGLLATGEERREVEKERELGQLHRLKGHRAQAQPPARAVDLLSEGRHQHEHEQDERHREERHHEPLEPAVVEEHAGPERAHPEDDPHGLPLQEVQRIVEAIGRHDGAGRIDHDHADGDEGHDQGEEPEIGRELPRHG